MIQLQRHIEILLLSHDCVIIPGFGGFIAHHVDAHYDEDERLFLPPYRTLGFNPQLTLNDSLLAQSYVEAYDMSYPDALRQIENEVNELNGILHTESEYKMGGVGILRVNIEGNIEFEPCEAGILTPEVYGLSDLGFKRLKDVVPLTETVAVAEMKHAENETAEEIPSSALLGYTDSDTEEDNSALVIKMSWVRNAVAIAAAIACFFLLATPVANSDLGNKTMSQLQGNIIYKLMPKDSNMTPAEPIAYKENKKVVAQESVVKPAEPKVEKQEKDIYCIVLASQVKRSNAEEFVEKLKNRGISDARITVENGTIRVVCGEYNDQAQAYNRLNEMSVDEEFADAWVYKLKGV